MGDFRASQLIWLVIASPFSKKHFLITSPGISVFILVISVLDKCIFMEAFVCVHLLQIYKLLAVTGVL